MRAGCEQIFPRINERGAARDHIVQDYHCLIVHRGAGFDESSTLVSVGGEPGVLK
jgi:hypothetical protein